MTVPQNLVSTAVAPRALKAVFWGGLAAGVLDGAYATGLWTLRGSTPGRVWQAVASGLLGPDSFRGGLPTAAFGLAIHFLIAFTAAAVFVAASLVRPGLRRRAAPCGLAFGLLVWAFMKYAVIPLSRIRPATGPLMSWDLLGALAIHAFGVGLPIALAARRLLGPRA